MKNSLFDLSGRVALVTGGAITINASTPCMTDAMCRDGTECKAGVCKPIIVCDDPMAGPGQCLDNRQACVNNRCQCVGDCNNDGIVRSTAFPGLWLDPAALIRGDVYAALAIVQAAVGDWR